MLLLIDASLFGKYKPNVKSQKRKAKDEVSSLFKKKSKVSGPTGNATECSKKAWKHKFVCLAFHDQSRIPTTEVDKDDLLRAGLGEKEVVISNLEIGADEFRDLLYHHFPSLKEGGGFQFYKCAANSRQLELLSPTTLCSPEALKTRVGNSRTYIKPLQKDLDMSAIFDLPGGVS